MKTEDKNSDTKNRLIMNVLKEKCPNCEKGNVYEKKKKFFELPVMKVKCDLCHYHFDREPGYFLGAMYISYGLAVFQGILTFLFLHFLFPGIPTIAVVLIILAVICLLSMKNYKLSRVIYMHIFPE
ncbi:MAG: DUF983 domain-containing protein [Bacteroidota bacterium]